MTRLYREENIVMANAGRTDAGTFSRPLDSAKRGDSTDVHTLSRPRLPLMTAAALWRAPARRDTRCLPTPRRRAGRTVLTGHPWEA